MKEQRRAGTKPTLPLEKYVGEYVDPAYGTAQITLENGELIWKWSRFRYKLEHYQDDIFRIHEEILGDPMLEFHIAQKRVETMSVLNVKFRRRGDKK